MMYRIIPFGHHHEQEVPLIVLFNEQLSVELLPFGAAVRALWVPDRTGEQVDVVLGYDDLVSYATLDACLGGTIGRGANRIGGACCRLSGKEFRLSANEGGNHLHGGLTGFHQKLWRYACSESGVTFFLESPDGEEGYPGTLRAEVAYSLEGGALVIDYQAVSDRDTLVNLTNHAYFNLAGHDGGPVSDHELTLRADCYTPTGDGNIPTGEITPVDSTPLDLRQGAVLGQRLDDPWLRASQGYDHNLVLSGEEGPAAVMYCPRTGIRMELETSLEGLQLYTAGFLSERQGKGGVLYGPRHAVCLETQHFPDAIHHPEFPSPVLQAGEVYRQRTVYRFSRC